MISFTDFGVSDIIQSLTCIACYLSLDRTLDYLFCTASHMLSLSLIHWLLATFMLSDSNLHCVELDIDGRPRRTMCDWNSNINVGILFFLMFSIRLISWWQRLITDLFSVFWGQFHMDVHNCLFFGIISRTNLDPTVHFFWVKSQYFTAPLWFLGLPFFFRAAHLFTLLPYWMLDQSRPSWFSGAHHSRPDNLSLSDSVVLSKSFKNEECLFCIIIDLGGWGFTLAIKNCKSILYTIFCHYSMPTGFKVCTPMSLHVSAYPYHQLHSHWKHSSCLLTLWCFFLTHLFNIPVGSHQYPMVTTIYSECRLLFW